MRICHRADRRADRDLQDRRGSGGWGAE